MMLSSWRKDVSLLELGHAMKEGQKNYDVSFIIASSSVLRLRKIFFLMAKRKPGGGGGVVEN